MSESSDPSKPEFAERRREPRTDSDAADWEQLAIRRVAGRVRSLPQPSGTGHTDADEDFGWERAVLERLRRRIDGA